MKKFTRIICRALIAPPKFGDILFGFFEFWLEFLNFFSLKIKIFEIGKRVEIYFHSYGSYYSIGFDE